MSGDAVKTVVAGWCCVVCSASVGAVERRAEGMGFIWDGDSRHSRTPLGSPPHRSPSLLRSPLLFTTRLHLTPPCNAQRSFQPTPGRAYTRHALRRFSLSFHSPVLMSRFVHRKRQRSRQPPSGGGGGEDDGLSPADESWRMKEAFLRMNFLYQSALASWLHPHQPTPPPPPLMCRPLWCCRRASHVTALGAPACLPLSRFFAHTMKKIGSRLVIRMSAAATCSHTPPIRPLPSSLLLSSLLPPLTPSRLLVGAATPLSRAASARPATRCSSPVSLLLLTPSPPLRRPPPPRSPPSAAEWSCGRPWVSGR